MARFRVPFFDPCFGTALGAQTVRCISSWPFSGPESGPCFGAAGEPQNMTKRRRRVILSNTIGSHLPQHTQRTLRVSRPASFQDPSQKPGALWLKLGRIWLKLGTCLPFPNRGLAFFRQVSYGWAVIASPGAVTAPSRAVIAPLTYNTPVEPWVQ